jgi:hypothetical protein
MLLNEYEIEFMFKKIRNIRNLGNVHIRGPHIVMSRTDAQNGLDFPLTIDDIDITSADLWKFVTTAAEIVEKRETSKILE